MSPLFDLAGEVAVVIGATGILGGALAEGLAAAGASVAVLGRNARRGKDCAGCITAAGGQGRAKFFAADAIDRGSLAVLPCQEFGPAMAARGRGSINVASVSAHLPLSRVVTYNAAKAAVISLTQLMAREWATRGARANSLTPGFFPAEQNRYLLFNEDGSPTPRAQATLGHTPMGRFGGASELVGAAVFVTGIDLRVGGFLS